jgi:hypothetical protein
MARVTYEHLAKDPDPIVEELIGRPNRALGGSAPIPQPPQIATWPHAVTAWLPSAS